MSSPVRLTATTTLVLAAVGRGVRHGFDILEATELKSGTVYPILRRLEDAGLLRSRWEPVREARDAGRPPRRLYELTGAGAEALAEALERHPGLLRGAAAAGARRAGGPLRPRPA